MIVVESGFHSSEEQGWASPLLWPVRIHLWILADDWKNDFRIEFGHHNAQTFQQPLSFVDILDSSHDGVKIIQPIAETENGFQNDVSGAFIQLPLLQLRLSSPPESYYFLLDRQVL